MRVRPSTRLPQEWEEELSQRSLTEPPRCHLSTCQIELAPARKGRPPKFCSDAHRKIAERNPELRMSDKPVDWWGPGKEEWAGVLSDYLWARNDEPDYGIGYEFQGRDLPPFNDPVESKARRWVPENPMEIIGQSDRPAGWDQKK
jgi:hypothetical protein